MPCKNRCRTLFLQGGFGRTDQYSLAEVAELADAHGSGPCTRKGVGVRVPSSAPKFIGLLFSKRSGSVFAPPKELTRIFSLVAEKMLSRVRARSLQIAAECL